MIYDSVDDTMVNEKMLTDLKITYKVGIFVCFKIQCTTLLLLMAKMTNIYKLGTKFF